MCHNKEAEGSNAMAVQPSCVYNEARLVSVDGGLGCQYALAALLATRKVCVYLDKVNC